MHACYPHLPLEPGASFPADVLDDGAFPTDPYDFSFWGFPCIKHSSLNRTATEADLVGALDLLERALHRLSGNPPSVFVLENTHSLLSGPRWVLLRITSMLGSLPYSWRSAPRISSLSPPPPKRCPPLTPPFAPRPPWRPQVHVHLPPPPFRRRVVPPSSLVGGVPTRFHSPLGASTPFVFSPPGPPPSPPHTTRLAPALCTLPPLTPPP